MSSELVPKNKFTDIKGLAGSYFIDTYTLVRMSKNDMMTTTQKVNEIIDANPDYEFIVESQFNGVKIAWQLKQRV